MYVYEDFVALQQTCESCLLSTDVRVFCTLSTDVSVLCGFRTEIPDSSVVPLSTNV